MLPHLLPILQLWETVASNFCFIAAIFYPLELLFPSKSEQKLIRKGWATDAVFFLGQHVLFEGAILSLFVFLAGEFWVGPWAMALHTLCSNQSWLLQAIEVVLIGDFFAYWYHRFIHGNRWFWPLHAVHHSAEELDWLATHREHPIDLMLTSLCVTLPPVLMGFPMGTLGAVLVFRGIWGLYLHSNTSLSPGILRLVLGSPELHRWHHSQTNYACNYANFSPWMDVLFGTYYWPNSTPEAYGISEPISGGYFGQIFHPIKAWLRLVKARTA